MPLVAWSPITRAPRARARAAFVEVKVQVPPQQHGTRNLAKTTLVDAFYPSSYSIVRELVLSRFSSTSGVRRIKGLDEPGGADRSRTDDIQLAKLALYQLSYSPIQAGSRSLVGLGGFEPPILRLSGVRSKPTEL